MQQDYRKGDYRVVADRLRPAAEELVAWTAPTGLVVDVAAGSGNVSRAVRARGARAVAVDLVWEQLELGRADSGGDIAWVTGDALALPLRDDVGDAVLSTFGVIYVADAEAVVHELARVCRPGGVLGLTAWPLGGYQQASAEALGAALRGMTTDDHLYRWGDEDRATACLSSVAEDVQVRRNALLSSYPSVEAWWERVSAAAPPLVSARESLGESAFAELGERLRDVARSFGTTGATGFVLHDEYLMVRGTVSS